MSSKFVKFKTRKSRNEPFHTHFLTFSTLDRQPFFANDQFCQILAESIIRAKVKHNFAVLAYVFMPDHIHLVVFPLDETYDMGIILKAIKLGATKCAQHLGLIEGSLWEPGGGHDRNVYTRQERLEKILYTHRNPVRKGLVNDMNEYRWSSANWYLTGKQADIECHFRDEFGE